MEWLAAKPFEHLYTTIVSIAEIRHGILSQPDALSAHTLTVWLETIVRKTFEGRTFGVDEEAILRWRLLSKQMQQARLPTPPADLLIAAIALQQEMPIATRDVVRSTSIDR